MTKNALANTLSITPYTVQYITDQYKDEHPEWFKKYRDSAGKPNKHYHPDLVAIVREEVRKREQAPEGWMPAGRLVDSLGADYKTIRRTADRHRDQHPEWFRHFYSVTGKFEFYHPDLVEIIRDEVAKRDRHSAEKVREKKQMGELEGLAKEISKGETQTAQEFQSLVRAFGESRALDVLYKFRPEFQGLPPERVRGVLADYLGDFLIEKGEFRLGDVDIVVKHLSDLTLREGLYETLKDHCLRYYFKQRRAGTAQSSEETIYAYLDHVVDRLGHLESEELDDVIADVISYYDSVLRDFHKPEQFVEALAPDREFPDINQRINMKELAEKQRLLIADEMGLGKSASVIMAKEQLGAKCALVIAPANVIATWQGYLSDEEDGYFKPGTAPRVLTVEDPTQLEGISADDYDYILISQGRMNEKYTAALDAIDYDMMVVDEIHKLKSLEGVRTQAMLPLSKKVEGEGKYLALLSGTPAPNKVEDIAIVLKLLYPDKFAEMRNQELVQQIIRGDIIDLRALLLPRMQMKSLEEGVEMPPLHEEVIETELSDMEREVYEVLLEEDELAPDEKMRILRQFLLNPELLDITPGIESTKIQQVGQELRTAFTQHDKVVMFANSYIEGVIRGEHNIIPKLGLPADVEVRVIHGDNRSGRDAIQQEFKDSDRKMLLVVSGQTADVGVDFSSGEYVAMYNEPWTEYDRRQQVARNYRPGLQHPLESRTFIVRNTIEEGIHDYIQRKYIAVEKLLRGIPIQELEQELLKQDEKRTEGDRDLEVNPELAKYYFSSWDKLMKIFAHTKEIGEEKFREFLSRYGKDYAECYLDLGNRSYQANANRVNGTLIDTMINERGERSESVHILDLASGPEMLKQHIADEYQERIISTDINAFHFKAGADEPGKKATSSWLNLPFKEKAFDYVNLALSLHYSNFVPSRERLERLSVLAEMNRALKTGGRAVISIICSLEFRDFSKFDQFANALGFRVVDEYTGDAQKGDGYKSRVITLEKVEDFEGSPESVLDQIDTKDYGGLKFRKTGTKLKDQRKIIDKFEFKGRELDVEFNEEDRAILQEERELTQQGEALKKNTAGLPKSPKKK